MVDRSACSVGKYICCIAIWMNGQMAMIMMKEAFGVGVSIGIGRR